MSDFIDAQTQSELASMTAEALIARGERLLKLGRELLSQAAHTAALTELPEERSVGRYGNVVSEPEAIAVAKELGQFTRAQFAERLGLSASGVSRWLAKLIDREHPVISRGPGGYSYIEPKATRVPERRPAVESELIDRAQTPQRGQAVRVPARQRMKQELSKSGHGQRIKRTDERYERQQAARDAREARKRNGNGKT